MAKDKELTRKWYVVDAEGVAVGRLATEVAKVLSGKNKPIWTPHVDTGDFVIVVDNNFFSIFNVCAKCFKQTFHTIFVKIQMVGFKIIYY